MLGVFVTYLGIDKSGLYKPTGSVLTKIVLGDVSLDDVDVFGVGVTDDVVSEAVLVVGVTVGDVTAEVIVELVGVVTVSVPGAGVTESVASAYLKPLRLCADTILSNTPVA